MADPIRPPSDDHFQPKQPGKIDQKHVDKEHIAQQYGQASGKPMTFLGMHFNAKEARELWNVLTKQISEQIAQEQKRMIKALRKLRKEETEK